MAKKKKDYTPDEIGEILDNIINNPKLEKKIAKVQKCFNKLIEEELGDDYVSIEAYDTYIGWMHADLKEDGWHALSWLAVLLAD